MNEEKEKISTNLFDYATSELSQDAFICWLVSWINYKKRNEDLYSVADDFLRFIFKEKKIKIGKFKIEGIELQEDHIDILIKLTNGYYIIIEDKTYSYEHESGKSGEFQLEHYRNVVLKKYKTDKSKIITVFYKTFDYDEKSTKADVNIKREDMLNILNRRKIDNAIYNDYRNRLQSIEDELNQRKTLPIIYWTYNERLISSFLFNNVTNNALIHDSSVGRSSGKHGSIFINWQFDKIRSTELFNTKIEFNLIHLAVDINYKKAYIYLKATVTPELGQIQNYDKEQRKNIQDRLKVLFSDELGDCVINHTVRSGKLSFRLLTIDVSKLCKTKIEELMEENLRDAIVSVTEAYEKIMKKENFKNIN